MRKSHVLRGNRGTELPTDAIWVDTETKSETLPDKSERAYLWFGYCAHRRTYAKDKWTDPDWLRFETRGEFWSYLYSKLHGKIKLYVFAHNWAFDAPVLDVFNELRREGWELKSAVIDSPPIILKWRKGPHTICFVDTLNIFKVPLAKIGKTLNLPKLEMPAHDATAQEWDTYGKRDTEIIMAAVMQWWEYLRRYDLGGFAPTISAQAMRTYRHRFMRHKILIDDNETALTLARQGYVGGRTEAWQLGRIENTVYKLDVNALYPFIMRNQPMPIKLVGTYKRVEHDELNKWLTYYCCIADVTIKTEANDYPLIHNKRLIFPVGEFRCVLNTPELMHALEHNRVVKIHHVAVYERAIIFKEYVEFFASQRALAKARGDEGDSDRCKRMLTNLYGKFGQSGRHFDLVYHTDDDAIKTYTELDAETGQVYRVRQYAGIVEHYQNESESRDSMPAIAAHVTSGGRLYLNQLRYIAGLNNNYYCDTDSLWTNQEGYDNLKDYLDDDILGKLKLEETLNDTIIHGLKDYEINGRRKTKGIKAKSKQIAPNQYLQTQFSSLVGLIGRGDLTAPIIKQVTKKLSGKYTKGIVQPGGRILPFRLTLGE